MDNEARLIAKIEHLLDGLEPDAARRVIDYFATTYRAKLKEREDEIAATAARRADSRPSFLQTEARIEAGEVLLELERQKAGKKRR